MRILHNVPQEFVDSWNHWLCMSEVAGVHDFAIKFRFCKIVVSYSADYFASHGPSDIILKKIDAVNNWRMVDWKCGTEKMMRRIF